MSKKNQKKKVEAEIKNIVFEAVIRSHKVYSVKPIRKKGKSGFYEVSFYDRVIYIDDKLNVRTEPEREPLKWSAKKDTGSYRVQSEIYIHTLQRRKRFDISQIRLCLWLYGDKDGNTIELFNQPSKRGLHCVRAGSEMQFNPKRRKVTKTLTKKYIHYDIK